MDLNANESSTHVLSGARLAGITPSFSASPPALGSTQLVSNGDPNHQRNLSFSEIHDELEQEQEAQVNRMMRMIRNQQLYLDQIRMQCESGSGHNSQLTFVIGVPNDLHEREAFDIPQSNVITSESASYLPTSPTRPSCPPTPRSPTSRSLTHGTYANNFTPSPLLSDRGSPRLAGIRRGRRSIDDELNYYEAEASWLARENQMLRMRVRKLEKQITGRELAAAGSGLNGLNAETLEIPSPLLDAMHTR
jgi:hypothetical protein